MIRAKRTYAAAFTLACDASGLDDKEIYLSLGLDAGYFSNMKKGKATLQGDQLAAFCQVVGNLVLVEWLASQVGHTLIMLKTEAERRADAAEASLEQERAKTKLLTELLAGRVG